MEEVTRKPTLIYFVSRCITCGFVSQPLMDSEELERFTMEHQELHWYAHEIITEIHERKSTND